MVEASRGSLTPELPPRITTHEYHTKVSFSHVPVSAIVHHMDTDLKSGLSTEEVESRAKIYGKNELPTPNPTSFIRMLLNQFKDFMLVILFLASFASFAITEYLPGVIILTVGLINLAVGLVQEYKSTHIENAFTGLDVPIARVIRNGATEVIPAADLVPGDVVLLEEGDQVPADIRLCKVHNFLVMESLLTGETEPVEKVINSKHGGGRTNMAYMVTLVSKGRAKGIVVVTGADTEAGQLSRTLSSAEEPITPIRMKLNMIGKFLVIVAMFVSALVMAIGAVWGQNVSDLVKLGVSLSVSMIPEGLMIVTTLTLMIGSQRLENRGVKVLQLVSAATLGYISVILCGKGTIAEERMKANALWTNMNTYSIDGPADSFQGSITNTTPTKDGHAKLHDEAESFHFKRSLTICALCNAASWKRNVLNEYEPTGEPIEVACMIAAGKGGTTKRQLTQKQKGWKFVKEFPFDPSRKRMSVVFSVGKKHHTLVKGGTESVLSVCSHINLTEKTPITEEGRHVIEKKAAELASQGMRVVALAYKTDVGKSDSDFINQDSTETDMVFIGLVGLIYPERPEVIPMLRTLRRAGIKLCLMTDDQLSASKALALKLKICRASDKVFQGLDVDIMQHSGNLVKLSPFPSVFSRLSPENKLDVVKALQDQTHVVALTGDSVDDAPALKTANCGIALGKSGTTIAKQSANVVIEDDNIRTLVHAIEEGRILEDNVKKYVLFLLTSNSAEILLVLLCTLINAPTPFSTLQILWANLIANIPALALGVDSPESDVMSRPPRPHGSRLLSKATIFLLIGQSVSMTALSLGALLFASSFEGYKMHHAKSLSYVLLITVQLFHVFTARSRTQSLFSLSPISNKWAICAFLVSFSLLIASIYSSANRIFQNYPLMALDWGKIAAAVIIHLLFVELLKLFYRCYRNRSSKKRFLHNEDKYGYANLGATNSFSGVTRPSTPRNQGDKNNTSDDEMRLGEKSDWSEDLSDDSQDWSTEDSTGTEGRLVELQTVVVNPSGERFKI
eukprot:TRINITY_DN9826_c0_g1_i1.p1 TRINITY_DN9826_c0_g1~~TRINITY_DN9826_c0_g1_i1.p1  ORF type:complete len:1169 (+),score=174.24 TRINITY_DN9826_c0_g1_i1:447-3509(+)